MREITRRTALGGAAALVLGSAGILPAQAAAGLTNPGFEEGLDGWQVTGSGARSRAAAGLVTG